MIENQNVSTHFEIFFSCFACIRKPFWNVEKSVTIRSMVKSLPHSDTETKMDIDKLTQRYGAPYGQTIKNMFYAFIKSIWARLEYNAVFMMLCLLISMSISKSPNLTKTFVCGNINQVMMMWWWHVACERTTPMCSIYFSIDFNISSFLCIPFGNVVIGMQFPLRYA